MGAQRVYIYTVSDKNCGYFSYLYVGVNHKFGETQDLPTQVEGVSEARLLPLFRGQRLHWLQVEVVVQVEVVKVLAVNQQIQHVVPLTADLETHLYPVQLCSLEELGGLQSLQ